LIDWSGPALDDVERIVRFLLREDAALASAMAQRVFDAAQSLSTLPDRARVGRMKRTRELLVPNSPCVIVFSREQSVHILRVLHARQKWP
jgi:plasmid stabilization system protein ParE